MKQNQTGGGAAREAKDLVGATPLAPGQQDSGFADNTEAVHSKSSEETGWLLERGEPPNLKYLSLINGMWQQNSLHLNAFRCARRKDAERLLELNGFANDWRITEHAWEILAPLVDEDCTLEMLNAIDYIPDHKLRYNLAICVDEEEQCVKLLDKFEGIKEGFTSLTPTKDRIAALIERVPLTPSLESKPSLAERKQKESAASLSAAPAAKDLVSETPPARELPHNETGDDFLVWWKTVWNLPEFEHIDSATAEKIWKAARDCEESTKSRLRRMFGKQK